MGEPGAQRNHVRYVSAFSGRYSFPAQRLSDDAGKMTVYACRTQSVSAASVIVAAPVTGQLGEAVTVLLEQIGFLKGIVARHVDNGFEMDIAARDEDRKKLAAKIAWLKEHRLRKSADRRQDPRRFPRNPRAHFYLTDGSEHVCFVIDISRSGAGVSAKHRPPVGTLIEIGAVAGMVVRHMDVGFGVQFDSPLDVGELEARLAERRDTTDETPPAA